MITKTSNTTIAKTITKNTKTTKTKKNIITRMITKNKEIIKNILTTMNKKTSGKTHTIRIKHQLHIISKIVTLTRVNILLYDPKIKRKHLT